MGISDTLSGSFSCFGRRLRIRWLLLLCIAATSTWFLLFPLARSFSPFELVPTPTPDQQPHVPPPQPTPGEDLATTPVNEVESATPSALPENWGVAKRQVRDAFKFALDGYLKRGYPMDEVRPNSGKGNNK